MTATQLQKLHVKATGFRRASREATSHENQSRIAPRGRQGTARPSAISFPQRHRTRLHRADEPARPRWPACGERAGHRSSATLRAASAAFPGQGEERHCHLLRGRGEPAGDLGLQAGADQVGRQAVAGWTIGDVPRSGRQSREAAVCVSSAWTDGQDGVRPHPASRRTDRRHRFHPLAHQQEQHARAGGELPLHGFRARWFPKSWLLD